MAVGSRSAEECHQKYVEEQQAKGSRTHAKKTTASGKPEQKGTDILVLGMSLSLNNFKFSICYVMGDTDINTHRSPIVKKVIFYSIKVCCRARRMS